MVAQPKIIKVLIAGTRGSGKSSIICKFIYDSMDGCSEAQNSFFRSNLRTIGELKFTFILKEIRTLPANENTAGYIITIDPTRETDLKELPYILENIGDKKALIALNKSDLKYISAFWLEDVKQIIGDEFPVMAVSAKTGQNIEEMFNEFAKLVIK